MLRNERRRTARQEKRDREEKERASVWDRKASLGQCNEAHWNERLQVTNQICYANGTSGLVNVLEVGERALIIRL